MRNYDKLYINGEWVAPHGKGSSQVTNPFNNEVIGSVPQGDLQDVDRAVQAAKAAFPTWAATSVEERAQYLEKLVGAMSKRAKELSSVISQELGMPISQAEMIQVGMAIGTLNSFPALLRSYKFEKQINNSTVVREPIGVCGFITPWNYPLYLIVAKAAPALAAGCTMVLKPSRETPLNAFIFAELINEVGLPPGVFNLVSGPGGVVGEGLAAHPDVDMVSITGSTEAGISVAKSAANTVKRVAQELGGKSANIILDDADLNTAVAAGVRGVMMNCGQTCAALTRMLVPESRKDEVIAIAKATAESITQDDPSKEGFHMGPLSSLQQANTVRKYIRKGIEEGATLVTGGLEEPAGFEGGAFVKPTIFADVKNSMTIAQEEIFGPVLSILTYKDEADAIRIANDTVYGLSGSVWSSDPNRALRVAKQLRTGQVSINGGGMNLMAPFGGYKQSGNGRELGEFGLEEYLEIKSVQMPPAAAAS
ncbi:MAG TPA: aldehyde dehydrogenase family protein [Pseudomonadales bacterium]|jgi:aldehyde dehydrogenase (NAD+)|nr:aldehyde dehydrogenase family protein [Pseudomonadales bacterium]HMW14201.1 aldehyde dehydrogenase family protein [Pseudomonadales bacterium]HMW82942.1 aldehyde dehydrogenase family protein [Pseudomonadales bacterium]HMY96769.1 aldehyde dehydrogenase family protein [Pseudomonadales bacterium]HMZ70211.1 aldehyde dehydrogenase family protein [Pseudomonadales bacterium]